MAKKRYKKLTNAQKKVNKEIRGDLRARGILPSVKPRLNRKKFAKEVVKEFKEHIRPFEDSHYLLDAIRWMTADVEHARAISSEHIGALKILKITVEIKKYMEDKLRNQETKYSPAELFEKVIRPIQEL